MRVLRAFLLKRWFLVLLAAGGVVLLTRPAWLDWTVWVEPRLVVALSHFFAAWTLESRSLYYNLTRPWPALWALAMSYGFLPAAASAAGRYLTPDDFRVGLLVMSCVPCTLASAVIWT